MDLPRRSQNSLVANAGLPRVRNRWSMGPRNRHHSGMGVRQAPRRGAKEPEDKRGVVLRYRVAEESHLVQESGRCDLVDVARARTPPRAVPLCTQSLRRGLSPDAAYVVLVAWLVAASTCLHRIRPSRRRTRWSSSLPGRSASLRSDQVKVLFRISIAPTNRCIIPSSPHCENTLNSCACGFVDP